MAAREVELWVATHFVLQAVMRSVEGRSSVECCRFSNMCCRQDWEVTESQSLNLYYLRFCFPCPFCPGLYSQLNDCLHLDDGWERLSGFEKVKACRRYSQEVAYEAQPRLD